MEDVLSQIKKAGLKPAAAEVAAAVELELTTNPLRFMNELFVGIYGQVSDLEKELSTGAQRVTSTTVCTCHA